MAALYLPNRRISACALGHLDQHLLRLDRKFIVSCRRQIPTRHIHSGRVGIFASLCQCLQRLFPQLTCLKLPLVFGQIAEQQFPGIDDDLGTPGLSIEFLGRRRDTHAAQEGTISQ